MTLGERICHFRMKQNMSQGDLANALDVSRQSVSKWETDASIPELNKLVRMSEVFHVSLDELVRGETPESTSSSTAQDVGPPVGKTGLATRKIVGLVLIVISVILIVTPGFAFVFAFPLLICAVICLIISKHTALWCGWAVYLPTYAYLRFATGIRFWWAFQGWIYREELVIHALVAWAMTLGLVALIIASGRIIYRARKRKLR